MEEGGKEGNFRHLNLGFIIKAGIARESELKKSGDFAID